MSHTLCIGKILNNCNEHISTLNISTVNISSYNTIKTVCSNANGGDDPHWWV